MINSEFKIEVSGWEYYSKLVLTKIDEHDEILSEINKELNNIKIDIGMLKVKAGIWGVIGGLVPITIGLALNFLK